MRTRLLPLAILLALSAGCDKSKAQDEKTATMSEAMPDLLLPEKSSFVSKSGTEDALSITLRTPVRLDQVAAFYRAQLSKAPWTLESDTKDAEGAIALYATRQGPPLWVRIFPDTAYNATGIQLTGASLKNVPVDSVAGEQITPGQ